MRFESSVLYVEGFLKKQFRKNAGLWKILLTFKPFVYNLLFLKPPTHPLTVERIIDLYSSEKKDLFFIQIGACDGVRADPINKFINRDQWSGILVEPVKYLFDELVINYKNSKNLIFENIAIAEKDGVKDFYSLKNIKEGSSSWKKMLGSFSPDHMPLEEGEELVKEKINCFTLKTLLKRNNVNKVDLLLIDTEGYDYEIIKFVDFNRIRPDLLIYEWTHLNLRDNNECIRLLKRNKYNLFECNGDILALSDSLNEFLKQASQP